MKAKIYNYRAWISFTDSKQLQYVLEQMLKNSGFNIVGFNEYHFDPQGYSAIWLISESHLAVHTWPEKDKAYVELSSCNGKKQDKFVKCFSDLFVIKSSTTTTF